METQWAKMLGSQDPERRELYPILPPNCLKLTSNSAHLVICDFRANKTVARLVVYFENVDATTYNQRDFVLNKTQEND